MSFENLLVGCNWVGYSCGIIVCNGGMFMFKFVEFFVYYGGVRRKEEGLIDFLVFLNFYLFEWLDEMFERVREISGYYFYYEEFEEGFVEFVGELIIVIVGIIEVFYFFGIFVLRGRRVIVLVYIYGEYERVVRIFGVRVVKGLNDFEEFFQFVERDLVVFFCNLNNLDGRFYGKKELGFFLDVVEDRNVLFVFDEVFIDFVESFESFSGENIVKLRMFMKSYGLLGIRVGYVVGFLEVFRSVRMLWVIGLVGVVFFEFLLEDRFQYLKGMMFLIWWEKRWIEKVFGVKSDVNFFIKYVRDVKKIVEELKRKGMFVRDCMSFGFL